MNRRNALACWAPCRRLDRPRAGDLADQARTDRRAVRAGRLGDIVSRIVAHEIEKMAGQPFIVDNKPGATRWSAPRSSRTRRPTAIRCCTARPRAFAANPSLYKQMTYDPDDFTTVAVDGTIANFMLVAKDAPYKTVKEFVPTPRRARKPLFLGLRQRLLARALGAVLGDERRCPRRGRLQGRGARDPGPDRRPRSCHLSRPGDRRELRALGPGPRARRHLAAALAAGSDRIPCVP